MIVESEKKQDGCVGGMKHGCKQGKECENVSYIIGKRKFYFSCQMKGNSRWKTHSNVHS